MRKHSMWICKAFTGSKYFLAYILVKTVDEFKGTKPEEIVKYIEGEPKIEIVPTEPGWRTKKRLEKGKRIVGLNTENSEIAEGLIRFDILFYVRLKDGLSQIIINVEAQKREPIVYKILNRAIFYASRLISSQKSGILLALIMMTLNGYSASGSVWTWMSTAWVLFFDERRPFGSS